MSGHSHWHSIRYKKSVTDAKRSKVFSKFARMITVAAKEGGGDPDMNPRLRIAIEQAKAMNFPSDNIEKAVKKGAGEMEGGSLESVLFEAYGPAGIAVMIEGITDNKNRTLGEIKKVLSQYNGKLVASGAVKWLFTRKGVLTIDKSKYQNKSKEELEIIAIDAGAEDLYWYDDAFNIYTKPEELDVVRQKLKSSNIETESASLDWVAGKYISVEEKEKLSCQKLFEALDDLEEVQEIYSNIED